MKGFLRKIPVFVVISFFILVTIILVPIIDFIMSLIGIEQESTSLALPEFEVIFFQILLVIYTLTVTFLILSVEILHPKRLIEVSDLFNDRKILYLNSIFIISTISPIIFSDELNPNFALPTSISLFYFFFSFLILIYLIYYSISLLDEFEFINIKKRRILQELSDLNSVDLNSEDFKTMQNEYLKSINRFFDATRIAVKMENLNLFNHLLKSIFEISLEIENEIGSDFPYEEHIRDFIWKPIYHLRNIGITINSDSIYIVNYKNSLSDFVIDALENDKKCFVTAKSLIHCFRIILKESSKYKRTQEVIGHGIYSVAVYLANNFEEKLKEWKSIGRNNEDLSYLNKGVIYNFNDPKMPINDIIDQISLSINMLNKHTDLKNIQDQAIEQLERYDTGNFIEDSSLKETMNFVIDLFKITS